MINNIPAELRNASGIYEIRNLVNGKVYIGSTNNFSQRQRCHKSDLIHHKHGNGRLMNAFIKYGSTAFSFSVLEVVSLNPGESKPEYLARLLAREYWHIDANSANTRKVGYNLRIDPNTNFGITLEKSIKLADPLPKQSVGSRNHNAVLNEQIVVEVKVMLTHGISVPNVARTLGVKQNMVGEIKRGVTWAHVDLPETAPPVTREIIRSTRSLNEWEVKQIQFLLRSGRQTKSISTFFGLVGNTAKSIKQGRGYRHIIASAAELEAIANTDLLARFDAHHVEYRKIWIENCRKATLGKNGKLKKGDVLTIKTLLLASKSRKKIAEQFGVSCDNINRIATGDIWSHVTGFTPTSVKKHNRKLTDEQVNLIKSALSEGSTLTALANQYGVTIQAISYIRKRI